MTHTQAVQVIDSLIEEFGRAEYAVEHALSLETEGHTPVRAILQLRQRQLAAAWKAFQTTK